MKVIECIANSAELVCTTDQYEQIFHFRIEDNNSIHVDLRITLCYDEIQEGGDKYLTAIKIYDEIYKKENESFVSIRSVIKRNLNLVISPGNIYPSITEIMEIINNFIKKERIWE